MTETPEEYKVVKLSDDEYREMLSCAECGATFEEVDTEWVPEIFQYGSGRDAKQLIVSVPVRECGECHFRWSDHVSEVVRDTLHKAYARDGRFQPQPYEEE